MDEIMVEIAPILKVRNQQIDFNSSCKGLIVESDRMMLIQVIMNLLSNSSKYSSSESVIEIKVERDAYHMIFNIKDQGIGLKSEDIPKLFKPFPDIDVDGSYNRMGLGLSIAKGIIELHDGEIGADSKGLGEGSRFWFTIPIKNSDINREV